MRRPNPNIAAQMGLLLSAVGLAVGCGGSSGTTTKDPCASLTGLTIPASEIGLATKGAKVTAATLVKAADATSGVEYCKVVGEIYPYTTSEDVTDLTDGTTVTTITTPNINFQVDIPTDWNYRTLQVGGGGFDGTIPSLDTATANGITNPLARGYATLGSDSGHAAPYAGGNANMMWNSEVVRNFGREQIKKTHDVAVAVIAARFGTSPRFNYFMGGSQGGHEALIAAQFYPQDFDGVVVGFPAYDLEAMHPGSIDYAKALYGAHTTALGYNYPVEAGYGWISRTQMAAVTEAIMTVCDGLDGAEDGMVSNPGDPTCKSYRESLYLHTSANPLRCEGGEHSVDLSSDENVATYSAETCLSDAQIETLAHITSRYDFAPGITLEGGTASYGKWPMLDGIWFAKDATKDSSQEDFGSAPFTVDAFQASFPVTDQLNMLTRHTWTAADAIIGFDINDYVDRVMEVSSYVDTSSVDYSAFRGRGGKMIHYHGSSDVSITPYNSIDLFLRMSGQFVGNTQYLGDSAFWAASPNSAQVDAYGSDATVNASVAQNSDAAVSGGIVDDFYSFYLIPGLGHGHGYFQASVDWLTALENWREMDIAPRNNLVATDTSSAHTSLGTRPVCVFPYYPKYTGAVDGDITDAANYTCTKLDAYSNLK
nr:tannase/feruloyl esterase family alpha/beta hydrolase [uncultured Holophaga sp.]